MSYPSITGVIEKLAGLETGYKKIIKDYSILHGKKIISSPFYFILPEICAAFDILTLKIPEFILNKTILPRDFASLYDAVVIPEKSCCCSKKLMPEISTYTFRTPSGFGEDSAVSLHNEISLMLKTLFDLEIKSINIEKLQRETLKYENLRRLVRRITSLRSENIELLSNHELSLIFETALILPPETASEYITPVFEEMIKIDIKNKKPMHRAMLYGGKNIPSVIADSIEESGILILEDDSCIGRRPFDISLNADSEYIFYEILDAYSYRPLTPCLRPANERYELLYKLLKNYNIETVIFFNDEECSESSKDIDYLRIRMMRDGIDPVVIDKDNYNEVVRDYVSRIS